MTTDSLPGRRFTCPCCQAASSLPGDIAQGYCGRCHAFTGHLVEGYFHRIRACQHRSPAAAGTTLHLTLTWAGSGLPPAGHDSHYLPVPPEWHDPGLPGVPDPGIVHKALAGISAQVAGRHNGGQILRAEWILTSDPGAARAWAMAQDTPACTARADQATAHLQENPSALAAVGRLHWNYASRGNSGTE